MSITHQQSGTIEMKKLADDEIRQQLPTLPDWSLEGGRLRFDHTFKDFLSVMKFVNLLADLAEASGHHPDFNVHAWNRITVMMYTHDVGGLTELDLAMASRIAAIPR